MKKLLTIIAALLFVGQAHAQGLSNLPPNTVVGRLGAGVPGPAQAIPFSSFVANAYGPATNKFFKQNGAQIANINDRLFIAGATANDGTSTGNQDWLSVFQIAAGLSNGTVTSSQGAILNNNSASAAAGWLAGIQTLNFTSSGTSGLATSSFAVNNNATLATNAWAYYGECHKTTSATGTCYGMEIDPRTTVAEQFPDPYQQGTVVGHQIACGAGLTSTGHPCSSGMQIVSNPETFDSGIVFLNGSITASGGAGSTTPAIALPAGYHILWDTATATFGGSLTVNSSKQSVLKASGQEWLNASGTDIFDCNVTTAATCTFPGQFVTINGGAGLIMQAGGAINWESGSDAFSAFHNGTQLQFQHGFSGSLGVLTSAGDLLGFGGVDNTPIGATTPAAGTFTTATAKRVTGSTSSFPTNNSCTGFTLATGSSDFAGKVTFNSATTCTISFGSSFTNAPFCTVSPAGTSQAVVFVNTTQSAMQVTFAGSQTAMYYICAGS